jgi:predicted  nucleic acid-binding Zn-ribbon protein
MVKRAQVESEKLTRQAKEWEQKLEEMTSSFDKLLKEKKEMQEQNNLLSERLEEEEERFRSRTKKNDERVSSLFLHLWLV